MKTEHIAQITIAPQIVMEPSQACTRRIGVLGGTGSGKTYLASLLVEQLYQAGAPVLVLDPVGNWGYGLRLAADGKGPGLPIPVIGGDHGDIGFEPSSGAVVGKFLRERDASAVIDVSELSNTKLYTFAADLMEAVYRESRKRRTPYMVVLEEAQLFVPQHAVKGQERLLGAVTKWGRLSRNYGGGLTLVTQRPQSVSKEVFNLVECMFVGALRGPHERKTVRDWVDAKGLDNLKDIIKDLPGLSPGEFWCWSPEWLKLFERIRVGKKKTFDGSSTPVLGKAAEGRALAPIELGELGGLMAATEEEGTVKEKTKELRALAPGVIAAQLAQIERERLGQQAMLAGVARELGRATQLLHEAGQILVKVMGQPPFEFAQPPAPETVAVYDVAVDVMSRRTRTPSIPPAARAAARAEPAGGGDKPNATAEYTDALLGAIAQHGPLNRHKLSILSGKSRSSSTFAMGLRFLVSEGLIRDDRSTGLIGATSQGRQRAKAPSLPTGRGLYAYWKGRLGEYDRRVFETIATGPRDGNTRQTIAELSGCSYSSSTFAGSFRTLRTLGLVVERGGRWRLDETVRSACGF